MRFSKEPSFSSHSLRPRQLCILAGAGISLSLPSSFPPAIPFLRHILRDLARGYATSDAYLRLLDPPPVKRRMDWEYLRFELIMDRLASYDPAESFLRGTYSRPDARPNAYHTWLAKLLDLGANVITTNFDLMIERACEELGTSSGVGPVVLTTDDECDRFCRSESTETADGAGVLQKLHGSVNSVMGARFPQLVGSRGTGPRYEAAATLMHRRTLVVLGYSGGDDFDVMPMLGYLYEHNEQTIVWIEHDSSTSPQHVSPLAPPQAILKPRFPGGERGQFERIRCDSATAVNLLCHESCPRLEVSLKTTAHAPLPSLDLTDWERLSLMQDLMKASLYAEQTGMRSAVGNLLPKVATVDDQSKAASLIHNGVYELFLGTGTSKPTENEITWAIKNASTPMRQRLMYKVLLLQAWLHHQGGAFSERDQELQALMAWCADNANWEIMTSAPDWAFRYCAELLEDDRRELYRKVGWHLMLWSRDLQDTIGMLYIVEDAEALLNDGIEMPVSYWGYQESLKSALFYNERLGNVEEARNAAAHLQRVEWVWRQFDEHRRYGDMVKQLDGILSRRVRKRSF